MLQTKLICVYALTQLSAVALQTENRMSCLFDNMRYLLSLNVIKLANSKLGIHTAIIGDKSPLVANVVETCIKSI